MKHQLLLIASVLSLTFGASIDSFGQWVPMSGPYANLSGITAFAVMGNKLFASLGSSLTGGVFVSSDSGNSWQVCANGLPFNADISCLLVSGTEFYAATADSGVFLSLDSGSSWALVPARWPNYFYPGISAMSIIHTTTGDALLASSYNTYELTNGSRTWRINKVIPPFSAMVTIGATIIAGSEYGIFRSTDSGQTWFSDTSIFNAYAFGRIGPNVIAGTTYNGIFRSTDSGATWTSIYSGVDSNATLNSFATVGSDIFIATKNGGGPPNVVYRSTDSGMTWSVSNAGLPNIWFDGIIALGNDLFVGTSDNSTVYRSTDLGTTWSSQTGGLPCADVRTIFSFDSSLFISSSLDYSGYRYMKRDLSQ